MRRLLTPFAICLLAVTAHAQQVVSTDEPPPAPLTLTQLLKVQARTLASVEQVGYKKQWSYETLTPEGVSTGKRQGEWEILWLKGKATVKTVKDEGSTGSGLSLPADEWADFSRWLAGFYSKNCETEFTGYEQRGGRLLLRYHTRYIEAGRCFGGTTWTDERGRVVEAEGRPEPARVRRSDGSEVLWPRCRVWMRADGLPDRMQADDILTLSLDQPNGAVRDKNGHITARRVRVKHTFRYYDYKRPRTGEPIIIEQGDESEQ